MKAAVPCILGGNAPAHLVITSPRFCTAPLGCGGEAGLPKPPDKEAAAAMREARSRALQVACAAKDESAKPRHSVLKDESAKPRRRVRKADIAKERGLLSTVEARAFLGGMARCSFQYLLAHGRIGCALPGRPDWFERAELERFLAERDTSGMVTVTAAARALGVRHDSLVRRLDAAGIAKVKVGHRNYISKDMFKALTAEEGKA